MKQSSSAKRERKTAQTQQTAKASKTTAKNELHEIFRLRLWCVETKNPSPQPPPDSEERRTEVWKENAPKTLGTERDSALVKVHKISTLHKRFFFPRCARYCYGDWRQPKMRKNPSPSMSLLASIRKLAHIRTLQFEVFFCVCCDWHWTEKRDFFVCVCVEAFVPAFTGRWIWCRYCSCS